MIRQIRRTVIAFGLATLAVATVQAATPVDLDELLKQVQTGRVTGDDAGIRQSGDDRVVVGAEPRQTRCPRLAERVRDPLGASAEISDGAIDQLVLGRLLARRRYLVADGAHQKPRLHQNNHRSHNRKINLRHNP